MLVDEERSRIWALRGMHGQGVPANVYWQQEYWRLLYLLADEERRRRIVAVSKYLPHTEMFVKGNLYLANLLICVGFVTAMRSKMQ